jgi:plastocyanin domain-containing protein
MLRASLVVLALVSACKKDDAKPAAAVPPPATTVVKDGVRHIAVEAGREGYKPDHIPGKPGEKLSLDFTRTTDESCMAQVVLPDNRTIDLPVGKAVEVAVTVPQTGQLGFVCGMDMNHGYVVAQPGS